MTDPDNTERIREDAARAAKANAIARAWATTGQPSDVLARLVAQSREIDTDQRARARKALQLTLEVASVKFADNPRRAQRPWTDASGQTWAQAIALLRFDERGDEPDPEPTADELFRRL